MTLGERIAEQRGRLGLSQSDLAERLEVSRQSVSKWETNASTPELDKLTKLCDLFGMTMDQLVRGEEKQEQKPAEQTVPELNAQMRKLVGVVLLAMGGILLPLILLVTGSFPFAFVMVLPLLGCSVMCLSLKKPGLWCGWFLWLLVVPFQQHFVRFHLLAVVDPYCYRYGLWLDILVSIAELLLTALLIVSSVRRFRSRNR